MKRLSLFMAALLLVVALPALAPQADADGPLSVVESEFRAAIQRLTPATVICVPTGVRGERAGFSSGVIVSRDGLVLSDGDAGFVWRKEGAEVVKSWRDRVDVRVPDPKTGRFVTYRARVLHRDTTVDTSILKIEGVPEGGLPFVPPGQSRDLRVGDFAFVVGSSSFGPGGTLPTLTAGVVAALEPRRGRGGGPYEFVYVSAAVNDGVNGGPLVDLEGRLVGTVSTYLDPEPSQRFQYLGKAVPMDRIRAALSGVEEARALFRATPPPDSPSSTGHALEDVFHDAAMRASPAVVSLTIERTRAISGRAPFGDETIEVPRYTGAVSGIAFSADGLIVTSLYNVANVGGLVDPLWRYTPADSLEVGLAGIGTATVHYPGVGDAPATFVGHDPRIGIAVFRADVSGLSGPPQTPVPAPQDAFRRGRFVLALGNPFGAERLPAPLLTLGILSKEHATESPAAWRGQWQTDAAGLDTNAGGAAVDVEGRLFGMMQLWHPARHGRGSGIAFVVPWSRIESSVRDVVLERVPGPGYLGVRFGRGLDPVLLSVDEDTAAMRAGLEPGDRLLAIAGSDTPTLIDAIMSIRVRYAGETVRIRYERAGEVYESDVLLGLRP